MARNFVRKVVPGCKKGENHWPKVELREKTRQKIQIKTALRLKHFFCLDDSTSSYRNRIVP